MMPKRLPESFLGLYGEAAGGRTVGSRLRAAGPPSDGVERRPWVLRRTDFDILGHVNNAAYWVVLEELVGERPEPRRRARTGPCASSPSRSTPTTRSTSWSARPTPTCPPGSSPEIHRQPHAALTLADSGFRT